MEDIRPLIFDIKRFAVNDGPGIRTTLFMKGCPLRCVWCHNPEGISPQPVKMYVRKKCIGCQSCVDVCPEGNLFLTAGGIRERGRCTLCGACTEACPSRALEMAGRRYTVDELMAIVEKERQVMTDSGGGVTMCGGEPLMHPDELCAVLDALGGRGMHRAVDTTLFAAPDVVRRVAERCELFLVDIKHMDSDLHRSVTGVPNERILANLQWLAEMTSVAYWVRIPMVDGVNCDEANMLRTADYLAALPRLPEVVCLLAYHDVGKGKHARLGTNYNSEGLPMAEPTQEVLQRAMAVLQSRGLNVRIGG